MQTVNGTLGAPVSQTLQPLRRLQVTPTATASDLVRQFNLAIDALEQATRAARSSPFASGTLLAGISFASGTPKKLVHNLGTPNVEAIFGVASSGVAAGTVTAITATTITISPTATFTASVWLLPVPTTPIPVQGAS